MSTADSALDRARHAQEELRRAAGDVAQLSHKVRSTGSGWERVAWLCPTALGAGAEGLCPCLGGRSQGEGR